MGEVDSEKRDKANQALEGLCREDAEPKALLLRHIICGLERRELSDWDLTADCVESAGSEVEKILGRPWLTLKRQYVHQRFFPWGQVDFLPRFVWHGLPYLQMERLFDRVELGGDGVSRPCLAHDAWILWMTGMLWGGTFNSRYQIVMREAMRSDERELRRCAVRAFGRAWGEQLMAWQRVGKEAEALRFTSNLRRVLFWHSVRKTPLRTLFSWVGHWLTELKHHLFPPFPWVAVLGPDGSGKSSVINGIQEQLKTMRVGVRLMHWRPNVFSKKKEVAAGVVSNPHGQKAHGSVTSFAKLVMLMVDWWLGFLFASRHARAKAQVWVSDRYYNDLLVDPIRYRYGASLWPARLIFRLCPKPDKVIVLTGDPEVIHARKQEVTFEELERQLDAYEKVAANLGQRAVLVDAGAPLEVVVKNGMDAVKAAFKNRPGGWG